MVKKVFTIVALVVITNFTFLAQSKPSIQGVWRRTEIAVTNPKQAAGFPKGTHTNLQPGLFVFTAKHYSVQIDGGTKPRPSIKDATQATREELVAAWGPFTSNSGTYELAGSTLPMRHIVAKNADNQGKGVTRATIKLEGDNLWMTVPEVPGIPKIEYPTSAKYVRVE